MNQDEIYKLINDVYIEGCYEIAKDKCSDKDKLAEAIEREKKYYANYLEHFFDNDNNDYYVLEDNNHWISAARITTSKECYYLEALETNPENRMKGFGEKLLLGIISSLEENGNIILRCNVGKNNIASYRLHRKCGFIIENENGLNFSTGEQRKEVYGMCYKTM